MMDQNQKSVFVDDEVTSQVLDIIQEAQQYAVIVTPYLKLWQRPKRALDLAVKRGVKVTVIVRRRDGAPETPDDIPWLINNGIHVLSVESLHAKIYLNESRVFVTSMNLLESSMKSSLEIGLAVQDAQAERAIRDYIIKAVLPLAKPVSAPGTEPSQQPVRRPARPPSRQQSQAVMATCIRCGRPVPPDPSKPLCDDCYDVWAEYGDEVYPERYCFVCGKASEVTYEKPLCRECFRKLRNIV